MRTHVRPFLAALAGTVLLTGCAGSGAAAPDGGADETSPAPAAGSTAAATGVTGFPLTVSSCGVDATLEAPPERIVTIKSSATEMVLALGAGDRLVGTAFSDGEVPSDLASAAADVPVLAEKNPATEAVLDLEPDLVYAGWESNLSADGAGERSMYADLGVATYVSPSACKGAEHQPDRLTLDLVFDEITEVGRLLGEEDAAGELVADQRAELDAVVPSTEGLTALWYSSGSETPFVGAGIGAPQMIMEAVGLENIAADVADTWTSLAWEAVAERNPDVIVLVDSAWNTAEHKIDVLEANPVTAALPAVQEGRYLTVPFPATEAGVRNVPAITDLAAQLDELEAGS
ncbi:putative F420-0 ABC transporter substrate-binding protein [Georgenia subflava]|uniref:Putative F420-0 ABC transporter substrate-binding protein n=1 Tax=Georgenia subflava TaxID=1622177 RepID=A0A6N7ESL5_9MICO|nr:putative F420-0 ABC transporter substrate-binding protein [Georgenia subflava]MPV38164.1 putative F420-0 ABC transporter substrate-binding protein [Georgenia subflava]